MATTQKPDVASDLPTKCGCGGDIVSGSSWETDRTSTTNAQHVHGVSGTRPAPQAI